AEDGIRDFHVTGVQTCALPICCHEGEVSARLGLPGIPEAAETVAVARNLALIEQTGVRAHFCGLSSARAVQMVAQAQRRGLPVRDRKSVVEGKSGACGGRLLRW